MKKTLLALALIGASTTAAADSWIYGGIQAGQADWEGETDTAVGVHVGTGILPFIGLEAGYWNFGSVGTDALTAETSAVYFAAKPSIDFGPLHVYARAGLHSYNVAYDGSLGNLLSDDDGIDIMYGVGVEYSVFPGLTVGAGYQSFKVEIDDTSTDLNTLTVNATIHFL